MKLETWIGQEIVHHMKIVIIRMEHVMNLVLSTRIVY